MITATSNEKSARLAVFFNRSASTLPESAAGRIVRGGGPFRMIIPFTRLSFTGPNPPNKKEKDFPGQPVGQIRSQTPQRNERDCSPNSSTVQKSSPFFLS